MIHHRKLHIDALADVVFVFHLGFGQRSPAGDAPINGLLAPIDETSLNDIGEKTKFIRLIFLVKRQVRIVPITQNAEALELSPLKIDVLASVGITRLADC